jgi:hypothetical protein
VFSPNLGRRRHERHVQDGSHSLDRHINRNAIDVVEKMVVAIEPRDLFGGPDRKHFWASPKDLFNAIPIDLIK